MPKTKVANPRDKRELHIPRGVEEVDADQEEWLLYQQQQQPHTQSGRVPMLSGLNRQREMSAMVSALTHVVSGEVPFGFVDESDLTQSLASGSGSGSGSSSSIGVGHKRGRQEEAPSTRLSRAFDDFTLEGSSSSIRATQGSSNMTSTSITTTPPPPTQTQAALTPTFEGNKAKLNFPENVTLRQPNPNSPMTPFTISDTPSTLLSIPTSTESIVHSQSQALLHPQHHNLNHLHSSQASTRNFYDYLNHHQLPPGQLVPVTSTATDFSAPVWSKPGPHNTPSSG
ncbi:ethylene-responsive transcription factor ERF110-like [Fagus crenata]